MQIRSLRPNNQVKPIKYLVVSDYSENVEKTSAACPQSTEDAKDGAPGGCSPVKQIKCAQGATTTLVCSAQSDR